MKSRTPAAPRTLQLGAMAGQAGVVGLYAASVAIAVSLITANMGGEIGQFASIGSGAIVGLISGGMSLIAAFVH